MRLASSFLIAASLLCESVSAFSTGAGGCSAGNTAVQSSHLTNPKTGSLADGGFSVSLAGSTLAAGSTSTFAINTDTSLTVASTGSKMFRGFLLRLGETGGVSTDTAFTFAGTDIQKAAACSDVGGVTHTSPSDKTTVSATLKLTAAATAMPLDVTVVVQNSGGVSEYYYSQFLLTSEADLLATPAPVVAGTPAPVTLPPNPGYPACSVCGQGKVISIPSGVVAAPGQPVTTCDVFQQVGELGYINPDVCGLVSAVAGNCGCVDSAASATPAPVAAGTPEPTPTPTLAPVDAGTQAPVDAGTLAPVVPITPAPIFASTPAPVVISTSAPITASTPSPVNTTPAPATQVAPTTSPSPSFSPTSRSPTAGGEGGKGTGGKGGGRKRKSSKNSSKNGKGMTSSRFSKGMSSSVNKSTSVEENGNTAAWRITTSMKSKGGIMANMDVAQNSPSKSGMMSKRGM